jgi:hypothetical protein
MSPILLLLLIQLSLTLPPNQPAVCKIEPESKLWIEGSSNVKSFSCFNESIIKEAPKQVNFEKTSDGFVFKNLTLQIPGQRLDCGNKLMNKDLQKALLCEEYPFIILSLQKAVILPNYDEYPISQLWEVSGQLSIAGTNRNVKLVVESKSLPGSNLQLKSKYGLMMSNYGISAPEPMMGLIKVHDKITIHFDLILKMAMG